MARMFRRSKNKKNKPFHEQPRNKGKKEGRKATVNQSNDEDTKGGTTAVKLRVKNMINSVGPDGEPLPKQEMIGAIKECVEHGSNISVFGGTFLQRCLVEYCTNPNSLQEYGDIGVMLNDPKFFAQCLHAHYWIKDPTDREELTYHLVEVIRNQYYPKPPEGDAPFPYLQGTGLHRIIAAYKSIEHMKNCLKFYEHDFYIHQRYAIKAFLRYDRGLAVNTLVDKILWKINGKDVTLDGNSNSLEIREFIDWNRRAFGLPTLEEEDQGAVVMPKGFIDEKSPRENEEP